MNGEEWQVRINKMLKKVALENLVTLREYYGADSEEWKMISYIVKTTTLSDVPESLLQVISRAGYLIGLSRRKDNLSHLLIKERQGLMWLLKFFLDRHVPDVDYLDDDHDLLKDVEASVP